MAADVVQFFHGHSKSCGSIDAIEFMEAKYVWTAIYFN